MRWLYSRFVFLFVSKGPLRCRRIVYSGFIKEKQS